MSFPRSIKTHDDYKLFLKLDLAAHGLDRWRPYYRLTRPELLFQPTLRAAEYSQPKKGPGRLVYYWNRLLLKRRSVQTGITISPGVCGPGLSIPHYGSVIMHSEVRVGAFCRIHSATNLGRHEGGAPTLGDFVYIGPGAVIYGDVTVGSHVVIGANAVVGRAVPDNSTAVGIPAKVLPDRPSAEVMPPWIRTYMPDSY